MSKQCVIVTSFVPVKICIFKKKKEDFSASKYFSEL